MAEIDDETRIAVLARANAMLQALRTVDAGITNVLKIIQRLDLEDPKLTTTLRSHGLVQEMSGVASSIADLEVATGDFFKTFDF